MTVPVFGEKKRPTEKSYLEARLAQFITARGLPRPVRQLKFHPTRKWTYDFAWPDLGVALEIEGAVFAAGRHTRGASYAKDCDKYNAAAALGWLVYRVTTQQFRDGSVFTLVDLISQGRPTYRSPVLITCGERGAV